MVQWCFPVNVWGYNLCWFTLLLLRTSQAVQFQTAFLLIHCIVHAIVHDTFSFFWEIYHKYLGFMEFAKYGEWGKFAASVGHPKAKRFSALGGGAMPSWPLTRGSAPGPRWRLRPQTSVIGSSSALAMCPPHIFWPGDALLIIKWCALHSIWQKCTDTHTQHLFRLTETLRIVIDF